MATENDKQQKHKPGPLKQQNKSHKHGGHKTKGQLDKSNKGKVELKLIPKKNKELDRKQRRHQINQIRKNKRENIIEKKRKINSESYAPHVIAVLSLSPVCSCEAVIAKIVDFDDSKTTFFNNNRTTIVSPRHRYRITIINLDNSGINSILDSAKVADSFLFVVPASGLIDESSKNLMTCLITQGLPAHLVAVQGLKEMVIKKQVDAKKRLMKGLGIWFPEIKLHSIDNSQDAEVVIRLLINKKSKSIHYREHRPYLMAEHLEFVEEDIKENHGTLKVSGFLRGKPLSVNGLIHLPDLGDFQINQIDAPADPYAIKKSRTQSMEHDVVMEEEIKVLAVADPLKQTPLKVEADIDHMEGEQTWPTEEEIKDAQEASRMLNDDEFDTNAKKKSSKGASDYQAAWILDEDDSDDEENSNSSDNDNDEFRMVEEDNEDPSKPDTDFDNISMAATTVADDDKYDDHFDIDEDKKALEKYRLEHENELFPDEIDTPMDIPAKDRFLRYRGLKSFRTSPWDPKENLPLDYARIFQFQNFNHSKRKVLKEKVKEDSFLIDAGLYVTLHIKNVPKIYLESFDKGSPLVVYGLLPHEHKMTVMHYVIRRIQGFDAPIKAKEQLIFHVGYRRFSASPIFSQHTNGNKFKMERFLPQNGVVVSTVYAPIMYPPAPVLVFNESSQLVATGSVLSSNPDRIIVKKIVLSGHPFKIHKKSSVIRYMFFNRDDILWFKPVELFTKYGRRGHIKEPLGTHGHMKCVFDGQLKAQDTVCMNLFKRVFPKWNYNPCLIASRTNNNHEEQMLQE
ncbi:pre-rRNA-processing protein TSR1 homolog isoform X2 [Hydra vulgaris]|uniref:Pre-rRNA-processing protein TSR1 homolog n=1 Tax=Hydra vulgaris TaxID=6087 RepID=A0ABM4D642_HYDVU